VRERQSASVSPRVPDCGVRTFVAALLTNSSARTRWSVPLRASAATAALPSAERQVESREGWSESTDLERWRVRRRRM